MNLTHAKCTLPVCRTIQPNWAHHPYEYRQFKRANHSGIFTFWRQLKMRSLASVGDSKFIRKSLKRFPISCFLGQTHRYPSTHFHLSLLSPELVYTCNFYGIKVTGKKVYKMDKRNLQVEIEFNLASLISLSSLFLFYHLGKLSIERNSTG